MFGSCTGAFFRQNGAQKTKGAFHSTKIPIWNFGNLRAQWIGTFWLHRPDPSHRAFGYCSCNQDTREQYWEQQFCQMERDISVLPTEVTRPVKEDHLESWSRMFRSDQIRTGSSIWCTNRKYRIFGLNGKRLKEILLYSDFRKKIESCMDVRFFNLNRDFTIRRGNGSKNVT